MGWQCQCNDTKCVEMREGSFSEQFDDCHRQLDCGDRSGNVPVPVHPQAVQSTPANSQAGQPASAHSQVGQPTPANSQAGQPAPAHSQVGQPAPANSQAGQPATTHSQAVTPAIQSGSGQGEVRSHGNGDIDYIHSTACSMHNFATKTFFANYDDMIDITNINLETEQEVLINVQETTFRLYSVPPAQRKKEWGKCIKLIKQKIRRG